MARRERPPCVANLTLALSEMILLRNVSSSEEPTLLQLIFGPRFFQGRCPIAEERERATEHHGHGGGVARCARHIVVGVPCRFGRGIWFDNSMLQCALIEYCGGPAYAGRICNITRRWLVDHGAGWKPANRRQDAGVPWSKGATCDRAIARWAVAQSGPVPFAVSEMVPKLKDGSVDAEGWGLLWSTATYRAPRWLFSAAGTRRRAR